MFELYLQYEDRLHLAENNIFCNFQFVDALAKKNFEAFLNNYLGLRSPKKEWSVNLGGGNCTN